MTVDTTDTDLAQDDAVIDDDVALEDIEVDLTDESEEQEDEAETGELENPEEVKSEDTEADVESEQQESKEEEVQPSKEDEQKAHNKMMAEQRIREKQERDAHIKQVQQEYVAEAEDDQSLALRQLQVDAYQNKVENNTNKLSNGYERAVKDFPILSDQTPEIKAEIDDAIDSFQALHVKIDKFGNPSEVSGDLYKYLQSKADSIERLTRIGARKQLANKATEKSKTFTPPSRTPKEPKIDLDLKAFEDEANRW